MHVFSVSRPSRRYLTALLALCVTVGCMPGPAATRSNKPVAAAANADAAKLLLARYGAGILSNNGSGIAGVVKAPPGIIGNNGGGIIGNNGGGIIGNNGGGIIGNNGGGIMSRFQRRGESVGYHGLAVGEQDPVGSQWVSLLYATGEPVLDMAKKPLKVQTDAMGRYRFPAASVPAGNLRVSVDLGQGRGRLEAIAPHGFEKAPVDLDLISSITTTYIVEQYLAGQANRQGTFNKLPAVLEQQTRAAARASLEAATTEAPTSLDAGTVVAAVDALRAKDKAFDATLETVRRVLIAAGQSDLGAGRQGTEIKLSARLIAVAEDGTFFAYSREDNRIWRFASDGKAQPAVGRGGTPTSGSFQQTDGPESALYPLIGFCPDGQGGLLLLEDLSDGDRIGPKTRVSRLGADGRLNTLSISTQRATAIAPDAAGNPLMLHVDGLAIELYHLNAQGTFTSLKRFTGDKVPLWATVSRPGLDRQGRFVLGSVEGEPGVVGMLDPRTMSFITASAPDMAVEDTRAYEQAVVTAPAGTRYIYRDGQVFKSVGGQETLLAGANGLEGEEASALALQRPSGLTVLPDGDFVLADVNLGELIRVDVAGRVKRFAVAEPLDHPMLLRSDADGNVFVVEATFPISRIRQIGPGGALTDVYRGANDLTPLEGGGFGFKAGDNVESIADFRLAADGTLYLAIVDNLNHKAKVVRRGTDGQMSLLAEFRHQENIEISLALSAVGVLYILDGTERIGTLSLWTKESGMIKAKTDTRLADNGKEQLLNDYISMEVDHRGRVYVSNASANAVLRYDPITGELKVIAGSGGTHFTGGKVDDSLDAPGFVTMDLQGNVIVSDIGHRQVKRIPAGDL